MTDEVKLLPCPFCGSKAELVDDADDSGPRVNCVGCDMEGPRTYWSDYEDEADCRAEVVRAWNTRPTIVTDEVVERVVAWRWRWVYPGRQNGWTLRQSPIEPLESNSLHVAREVEPLYSHAAIAAMPAIVGGE